MDPNLFVEQDEVENFKKYKMEKGRRQAMGNNDDQEEEVTPNPFANANLLIRKQLSTVVMPCFPSCRHDGNA